jgi:hypothetical protein
LVIYFIYVYDARSNTHHINCSNFDGEFWDGTSGTQNKQAQHTESCSTVRKNKRGGEELTLLTGIPEMSGTNLGRVDGYFVNILWLLQVTFFKQVLENYLN